MQVKKLKKCFECSETKEYEKMFCELFVMVSVNKFGFRIFFNQSFFLSKSSIQVFLGSKTYLFIYVKKKLA